MTPLRIRILRDPGAIDAGAWAALAARPPASVNGSRTWVAGALSTINRDTTPHLIAVDDDARLVALLPLVIDNQGCPAIARNVGWPDNDLTDALVLRGYEGSAARVLDALHALAASGCAVELDLLDPDGALASADRTRRVLTWAESTVSPALSLAGHWRSAIPAKMHRQWDRALRRLRALGHTELRWLEGPHVEQALPEFMRLRELRVGDDRAPLEPPPVDLLQAVVPDLARAGCCACAELRVDGSPLALDLYLLDRPVALLWLRAMAPAARPFSGGHVLLRATAERLMADGYRVLDFGVGDESYKFAFGAWARPVLRASRTAGA